MCKNQEPICFLGAAETYDHTHGHRLPTCDIYKLQLRSNDFFTPLRCVVLCCVVCAVLRCVAKTQDNGIHGLQIHAQTNRCSPHNLYQRTLYLHIHVQHAGRVLAQVSRTMTSHLVTAIQSNSLLCLWVCVYMHMCTCVCVRAHTVYVCGWVGA